MNNKAVFFNFSINGILSARYSTLDNARIKLLYYGLALAFFTSLILFFEVLYKQYFAISIIAGALTTVSALLFKYLTYRPQYRAISHIALVTGTIAYLVNIYVAKQSADAISVGVIALIVLLLSVIQINVFLDLWSCRSRGKIFKWETCNSFILDVFKFNEYSIQNTQHN